MGYAEAIEHQVALLNYWASPDGLSLADTLCHLHDPSPGISERAELQRRSFLDELADAEPYYVSPEICRLFTATAPDLGTYRLRAHDLPGRGGFVLFAEPLPLPPGLGLLTGSAQDDAPVRALCWASFAPGRLIPPKQRESGVMLTVYLDRPYPHYVPGFLSSGAWPYNEDIAQDLRMITPDPEKPWNDVSAHKVVASRQYLASLFLFVAQAILTTATRVVANRSARKRLTKNLGHEPFVRVVELRQREYGRHGVTGNLAIEWSCQWLVRGHWHTYHTKDGTVPIFVQPYMKGPPDKPLRVPEKVAYEVVR